MPAKTQGNFLITDLRIPYKSFNSAVSTDLAFQDGANVLTTVPGYLENRPGFATVAIPAPGGGFTGTVKSIYLWHKISGTTTSYFGMVCSTDSTQSYVYKFKFGTDANAVLIRTCTNSNTPFWFVDSNQTCYFGKDDVAGEMWFYDGTSINKWGITRPSVVPTVSLSAGSLDITTGWYYRYGYGNSSRGSLSTLSDLSACTGATTGKQVGVGVTASGDAQVDQIRVFRTTDGGSTNPDQMQELPNSPFANSTATITDTSTDVGLLTIFGPALLQNDPPPAMKPLCVSQNRIWGIAANKLYYSGFEEIGNGVPEECFPSGLDGNFRPYPSPLYGLAPTSTGVAIFTAKKIFGVDGDSLDTFRWGSVLDQRGTKFPKNVAAAGGSVLWLDTSGQFWLSDIGEMGTDIRVDTKLFTPSLTQIAIHNSDEFNWVVVMDGANGKLFVANMDNKHWMVPWPISGVTAIASGETADGTVDLLGAINGVIYKIVPGTYNDAGTLYKPWIKWNLFSVAPDETPDWYGVVDNVALETDSILPADVRQLNDDDPRQIDISKWISIKENEQDSTRRASQGTAIIRKEYTSQPVTSNAQRIAVYIEWPTKDQNFHLYSMSIKHHRNG
jgi:hypothetical protein